MHYTCKTKLKFIAFLCVFEEVLKKLLSISKYNQIIRALAHLVL